MRLAIWMAANGGTGMASPDVLLPNDDSTDCRSLDPYYLGALGTSEGACARIRYFVGAGSATFRT